MVVVSVGTGDGENCGGESSSPKKTRGESRALFARDPSLIILILYASKILEGTTVFVFALSTQGTSYI